MLIQIVVVWFLVLLLRPVVNKVVNGFINRRELFWSDYVSESEYVQCLFDDMTKKIFVMRANKASLSEWLEIIPICEYTDEWYTKTYPGKKIYSLKKLAETKANAAW